MTHLIPLSERDFKTLAKQYLNTLREQTPAGSELPTLMQAQELLAKACGHQSLYEAKTWWAANPQGQSPDAPSVATPWRVSGTYDLERALQDTANVKRLRELLLRSAQQLSQTEGAFSQNTLLRVAGTEVSGQDHYTLYHLAGAMLDEGELAKHGVHITTRQWIETAQELQRMGNTRNTKLQVNLPQAQHDFALSAEQNEVVAKACSGQVASVVETHNGAGKAIMVEQVCMAHKAAGYDVIISALSWQDTHVMSYTVGQSAKAAIALDPLLKQMHSNDSAGRISFDKPTLVVLEEAGRVPAHMLAKLMSNAELDGSLLKVLLVAGRVEPHSAAGVMKDAVGSIQVHKDRRGPAKEDQPSTGESEPARRPKI